MCRFTVTVAAIIAAVALSTISATIASAGTIDPGHDLFGLVPGTGWLDLGADKLPSGYFDPGSDPFEGQVAMKSWPTGPMGWPVTPGLQLDDYTASGLELNGQFSPIGDPFDLPHTDTIVRRLQPANLPGPGASAVVPIEIVSLSLTSIAPIQVTHGGGGPDSFFDVFTELSIDPQTPGNMQFLAGTVGPGDQMAGTFTVLSLPVKYDVTFVEVGDPAHMVTLYGLTADFAGSTGTFWIPEPASLMLMGIGSLALLRRRN